MSEENTAILEAYASGTEVDVDGPGSVSASALSPVRRRRGLKRSSAACQRCRQRKQKCDGKHPSCESCLTAGVACIPSERFVIRTSSSCNCDQLSRRVSDLRAENESLRRQLQSLCQASQTCPRPDAATPIHALTLASQGRRTTESHDGSAEHNVYRGRILLPTFGRRLSATGENTSFLTSPWHLWQGIDSIASEPTPTCSSIPPSSYSRSETLELVNLFFTRRWPQFPVLHKPTFMVDRYEPFIAGQRSTGLTNFQVNIVLAIGASEKARTDDIDCIQSLLLLCIYGSNEPESVDLWYTVGLVLRLALGIDMHRRETHASDDLDFVGAEMRKRLFWSIYTMDRSIAIAMGRPIGLQDADITTALPLCLTDEQLLQPRDTGLPSMLPSSDDLSSFLHIIQLRRINAEIYTTLHAAAGKNQTEISDAVMDTTRYQFLSRLNEWLATAPRYIAPTSMHQTAEWQQIAYHQAILTLFRPSGISPVVGLGGMRLCVDSAISLVSCYHALYAKNKVTYTFVALVSLFMAALTMLYILRASPLLRLELTKEVTQSNVSSCAAILRRISAGRSVGERSAEVVERLGRSVMAIFESTDVVEDDVDTEFTRWFGLRCQHPSNGTQSTPSIDMAWTDLLEQGFDLNNAFYSDIII